MRKPKACVLVTGISGYIACHVAKGLLTQGYHVRGSVRDMARSGRVETDLKNAGADVSNLSFIEANLDSDNGWNAAVKDCAYIVHLASPFPAEQPSDREALVPQARAGSQRVLAAGFAAGAKRIVMTSSMVSMMGKPGASGERMIGEESWSDPQWKALTAYDVSKTRAELSAWEFARVQGFEDRLTVINPSLVLGPAVGRSYGTSVGVIEQMFSGQMPRTPKLALPIVDVRDVAALHIAAMTAKDAGARRLIAASSTLWMREVVDILRTAYPKKGRKLPHGDAPNFLIRLAALFDDQAKSIVPYLGRYPIADTAYVTAMTGIKFRPVIDSILETAAYLDELGKLG